MRGTKPSKAIMQRGLVATLCAMLVIIINGGCGDSSGGSGTATNALLFKLLSIDLRAVPPVSEDFSASEDFSLLSVQQRWKHRNVWFLGMS